MLTLSRMHDATIMIDDEPVTVHIRRILDRSEALEFERAYARFGQLRGDDLTDEQQKEVREFVGDAITKYISVEPGSIIDDGQDVVTGSDLVRTFTTRADVLRALYLQVYAQNFLGKAQKSFLEGLSLFKPGSAPTQSQTAEAPAAAGPSTTDADVPTGDAVH